MLQVVPNTVTRLSDRQDPKLEPLGATLVESSFRPDPVPALQPGRQTDSHRPRALYQNCRVPPLFFLIGRLSQRAQCDFENYLSNCIAHLRRERQLSERGVSQRTIGRLKSDQCAGPLFGPETIPCHVVLLFLECLARYDNTDSWR